jgi:UDP-N-acetylmuramate dehydrogenase
VIARGDGDGAAGAQPHGRVLEMTAAQCRFGYRDSVFRREEGRFVVLAVTLALKAGGRAAVRYPELRRALGNPASPPGLAAVREAVLELRRTKSMVLDEGDPNTRSVGSFFVNPVVSADEAAAVGVRATRAGLIPGPEAMPAYPAGADVFKLSAAWLIECAGFEKGMRRGQVGVSSRHTLALVHHGGGRAADLVALAREVQPPPTR